MARRRIEPAKPLKRKVATRKPKKTLLIFCEGQRTEPEYLEALKRESLVRDVAAVDLRVETGHGGSVPLTLVALALQAQEKAGDEEGEIDEFWCVFDVEWPALQLRRRHDGKHDKGLDSMVYMPTRHAAAERAAELDKRHLLNDTPFPDNNPSSGMHRLLKSVESHA